MTDTTDPVEKLKLDTELAAQRHRLARFMAIVDRRSTELAQSIGLSEEERLYALTGILSQRATEADFREVVLGTLHHDWPEMFADADAENLT